MSPAAKSNFKYVAGIVGIIGGIITIIIFSFVVGRGFEKNASEHLVINSKIDNEVLAQSLETKRSIESDQKTTAAVVRIEKAVVRIETEQRYTKESMNEIKEKVKKL